MTRRSLVAGNWKMNGSRQMTRDLAAAVAAGARDIDAVDIVLCPPAAYLADAVAALGDTPVATGAQDCSEFASGAYTGEIAALMIKDCGGAWVIVGHSERRQLFGDTDERVGAKTVAAYAHDLVPVVCVGETLPERRQGATEDVIGRQLGAILSLPAAAAMFACAVIAYEPVWAIGTGESATPEQAQAVHAFIRARLDGFDEAAARTTRIVYGGSVKPANADALFAMPDIDGGLIGGASLDADSFLSICRAAQ